MLAQASTYFLSFFYPPFVHCYSCHLCYQRGSGQAKEVGWCKIQYIWTFLFCLFLAICLLLFHLHCHKCYG
jgi:glycerol-3-phosphate acyltransferase PlsY